MRLIARRPVTRLLILSNWRSDSHTTLSYFSNQGKLKERGDDFSGTPC